MNFGTFRGKTTEGKMVEGCLFRKLKKCTAIEFITIRKRITSEYCIQTMEIISGVDVLTEYKIIPETIAACTGAKDKNGVDIFGSFEIDSVMTEGGDRVKFDFINDNGEGDIVYHYSLPGFIIKPKTGWYQLKSVKNLIVIGNQYDTKD